MYLTNNQNFVFKAKISENIQSQLYRQAKASGSKKKIEKQLKKQIENVKNWGSPNSEIVICQNYHGNYSLGLKTLVNKIYLFSKAFENLNGRTELSQFLGLKEDNIVITEKTIDYLYRKYGADFFSKKYVSRKKSD